MNPSERLHLLTYADDRFSRKEGRYRLTQERLTSKLATHPDIADIFSFTDEDLVASEWYAKNEKLFGSGCTLGAGNAQKAYFVDKVLSTLAEGQLVLYHDCSPEIWDFSRDYSRISLQPLIRTCDQNGGVLVGNMSSLRTQARFPHLHRSMSAPGLIEALDAEEFLDRWQWCASWILLRNTEPVRQLVKAWLSLVVVPEFRTLQAKRDAERQGNKHFIAPRGDQSILTLLMLKRGMKAVECFDKNIFSADASAPLDDGILTQECRDALKEPSEILRAWENRDARQKTFFGIDVSETAEPSQCDDLLRLLEAMRPKPSPAPLVRIGPDGDGGYLVPDDLKNVAACFSPGVADCKDFEDQLALEHGIASHLCDRSSDLDKLRTPLVQGLQTFERLWLDVSGTEESVSLDDWVERHSSDPREDLILQMDIEGAEYRNILQTSDDTLKRFRIIVVEVHGLLRCKNSGVLTKVLLPFFSRLGKHFTCVHAHANNVSESMHIFSLDVTLPDLIELTFLRNDRFEGGALHDVELPHPHDIRFNVQHRPPVFLDNFFRGRPPSPKEMRRMTEDFCSWGNRLKRSADKTIAAENPRIGSLETAMAAKNAKIEALEATMAAKNARIQTLEANMAAKNAKIEKLRSENKRLADARQRLTRSLSWRLTAPMRRIRSIFGRPRP